MKKKLKSNSPSNAAACSPSSLTPETDAQTWKGHCGDGDWGYVVYAHWAKKLECERDALKLQLCAAKCTLAKWQEWARMHGHLDHAAGIADDSRRILSSENVCDWEEDEDGTWETDCSELFEFNVGGPLENGFEWCPYCGKKLKEAPYSDQENV